MNNFVIEAICFAVGFALGGAIVAFINISSYNKGWDEGYQTALKDEFSNEQ